MRTRYCTILALMILSACSRNMDSLEKGIEEMSFVAAIEQPQDTSATKTLLGGNTSDASRQVLWCASDEICVAAGDKSSKFVNAGSSNSVTATFEGSIAPADTYYAAYPYSYVTGFSSNGFSLNLPSTQNYRKDGFDDDSFPMVAKTTGGTFNFLNLCGIFVLNLTGDKSIESLTFSAHKDDGSEIPVAGTAKVSMDYASVPSLNLTGTTHPSVTLVCAEPVTLSPSSPTSFHIILPPGTYPSFSIIVYATDGSKMQISSSKPMTINRSSRTVASSLSYKELDAYVDLGLSVMWATCNIGADTPEQYGGYYQWGGLEDVTSTSIYLDWSNCPYHTGSSSSTGWTKYVPSNKSSYWSGTGSPDNKTVLDPEDDVAHVKLGGKWRMPTDAEWTELIDNCTWTWTTQNGVKGCKVTSKKNGNSIFLPAAGYRYATYLNNVGSLGYYWSSSLNTNYPSYAYSLYFYSSGVYRGSYDRYTGQSVRPVYDHNEPPAHQFAIDDFILNYDYSLGRYVNLSIIDEARASALNGRFDEIGSQSVSCRLNEPCSVYLIQFFQEYEAPPINDGTISFRIVNYPSDVVRFNSSGQWVTSEISNNGNKYSKVTYTKYQWDQIRDEPSRMYNGSAGASIELINTNKGDKNVLIEIVEECSGSCSRYGKTKKIGYFYVVFRCADLTVVTQDIKLGTYRYKYDSVDVRDFLYVFDKDYLLFYYSHTNGKFVPTQYAKNQYGFSDTDEVAIRIQRLIYLSSGPDTKASFGDGLYFTTNNMIFWSPFATDLVRDKYAQYSYDVTIHTSSGDIELTDIIGNIVVCSSENTQVYLPQERQLPSCKNPIVLD